jgi:arylsulfatase A-like enzyme
MRHLYERSIALMDDWLARIREALHRHGLSDDTTLIVTSDHGENFGETPGLIGHAGSLDDRLLRVPLVMAGPRTPVPSDGVTSLTDLPRLVAGIAGLADHPWGEATGDGVAIAQYDGPVHEDRRPILDEWNATADGVRRLTERFTAATDGEHRLVRSDSGDEGDDLPHLRAALDRADATAWDPDPEGTQGGSADAAAIEERMRLLGYL